jgi:hypothetical protein
MIDGSQRQPQGAAISFSFFAIGQVFQWLSEPTVVQALKDYLSIISFLISITVGLISLAATIRKMGNKNKRSKD